MSEELSTANFANEFLVRPEPDDKPARTTRPYMVEVFGRDYAVEASNKDAVIAHMVRRLRREIAVELADFTDGAYCAKQGIELEVADSSQTIDMFTMRDDG